MEATRAKSGSGFGQSWRELSHTPTHQVPIVLGAFVALITGILTYLFDASKAGAIVAATAAEAYLVIFGIVLTVTLTPLKYRNDTLHALIIGLFALQTLILLLHGR